MDLRLFCLFLVCLSLGDLVNGEKFRNITARGYWKRIFEDVNSATVPNEYTAQYFHGVKTEEDDESTVTVKASGPNYYGLSEGDRLKILSIDFGSEGQRMSSASFRTLKEAEIHRQREQTLKFTIQPGQKVVKWQFVIDIAGNEYSHDPILTYANDEIPKDFDVKVTVLCRKLVHFGSTRIRIKHRATNRYLTIVPRGTWPAATTGLSNCYNFLLYNYGSYGVVIRTLNSMRTGYEYLRAWGLKGHWIYGYIFQSYSLNKDIYWSVCKTLPLYDGDAVTFMNQRYRDAYLCRSSQMANSPDNTATDVFICQNQPDEWILEVV